MGSNLNPVLTQLAKTKKAVSETGALSVVVGGGVACNKKIRERIQEECSGAVYIPSPGLCIDNAAMTAGLGHHFIKAGIEHDLFLDVDSQPIRMKLKKK